MSDCYKSKVIAVIGLRELGLPIAVCLASQGIKGYGVEADRDTVEAIRQGIAPDAQNAGDAVVENLLGASSLRITTQPEPADAFILVLPSHSQADSALGLNSLAAVAISVAPVLRAGNLVVLQSSCNPEAAEQLSIWLADARPDLSFPQQEGEASQIRIAYCAAQAHVEYATNELLGENFIIAGVTPRCAAEAAALYKIFMQGDCVITDLCSAKHLGHTSQPAVEANGALALSLSVGERSYRIVLPSCKTDYIQKKLVSERVPYELGMLQDIGLRVGAGELVVDVGANIGNHTLYLASVVGCKVQAFEPNPQLCAALRDSIRLNGLEDSVRLHESGVGSQLGRAHFGNSVPENLGAQHLALGNGELQVTTLDSIEFEGPVRVLKIDVEGMEDAVLEGGRRLIECDRPLIYVECQNEAQYLAIARFLEPLRYVYWETFNATPTHLFVPFEQTSTELAMRHLQSRLVQKDYQSRAALTEANQKNRQMGQRLTELTTRIATKDAALNEAKAKLVNNESVIVAGKADLAKKEADIQRERARNDELRARADAMRDTLAQKEQAAQTVTQRTREAEQKINSAESTAQQLRAQLDDVEEKYRGAVRQWLAIRSSSSFRIGHALVLAMTTPRKVLRLPKLLWEIHRQRETSKGLI